MSEKPFNVGGINKNLLKSDCNAGSTVTGLKPPILSSFASDQSPRQKTSHEVNIGSFFVKQALSK